jgi:iron complex outermembrane recepter protein
VSANIFESRRAGMLSASLMAMTIAIAGPAMAQTATAGPPPAKDDKAGSDASEVSEIVVTGTLLRGVAPVGTNVIGVGKDEVIASGAASTNDLLATIPQVSNFNGFPAVSASFGQPIAQTNLRGLGASGGTTTLVLLNGHRVVGAGILQTYVDPTVIPPGIIDRVEVIPDGGSSIYGSDAIGGVINFITRKRVSGAEVSGKYGVADGYHTFDSNLTIGKDWGSGSLSASYAYAWHDDIQGRERGYVTQDNRGTGGTDRRATTCAQANITVAGVSYALPGRVAGTQNRCDTTDYADVYPRERRHTVFVTLDQEISDDLTVNVTGYYSIRNTNMKTAALSTNSTITSANPYFQAIGTETSQSVLFNYAPVFGDSTDNPAKFSSEGITPTFDLDLGRGWKLRGLANFGHSYSETNEASINSTYVDQALRATTTATALNPYDVTQTNGAVLAAIRDYTNISKAKQDLAEGRLVADGTLFAMPGGDVRLAVGAEYHHESIDAAIAFGPKATPKRNAVSASRNVKSVFGEVFVPLVGAGNARPFLQALDLTGSVRYDDYSDVGGTTNPKIGFNYTPFDGIRIRGNWGTSFHAPSLADTTGAVDARVTSFPIALNVRPGDPAGSGLRPILYISGGSPTLRPETADTWSLGADFKPKFLPGVTASVTYYNVDFSDVISVNAGGFNGGAAFYADASNAPYYILNPTLAQAQAFSRGARADNFDSLAAFFATNSPYAIYDLRRYNRGRVKQDGIDFNLQAYRATSFGSLSASLGGTYTLNRKTSDANNGIYVDRLKNGVGRFNYVATAGGTYGKVTARATLTHSGGYPILGEAVQSKVGAYNTVDFYAGVDLGDFGPMQGTQLTLNVDNLFDKAPPWRNANNGYANGSTLGRLVSLGVRTKF